MSGIGFTGMAQWFPTGSWNLAANIATTPTKDLWQSTGSSLPEVSEATASAVINTNGLIIIPSDGRYDILASINSSDWGFKGTMTVVLTYIPLNTASISPTYILGTINITPTNPSGLVEQRVFACAGDQIKITFAPTTALKATIIEEAQSILLFTNVTMDTQELQFFGPAGRPPNYISFSKGTLMQTAAFTNGIATLTATQDGTVSGRPLFKQILGCFVTPQSPTIITGPLGVASYSVDPVSSSMQTITVHISVNGALPVAGWTCMAMIFGTS